MEKLTTHVSRVIRLARDRKNEHDRLESELGLVGAVSIGDQKITAYTESPRPANNALRAYLNGMPADQLLQLAAVMYYGRDTAETDLRSIHDNLKGHLDSREVAATHVADKMPLDDYLEAALVRAKDARIDLDAVLS